MPRPDRMLKILQLLSHRRATSLSQIMSHCDIPERTAYRYLNALSEANIPVYYDRIRSGYMLAAPVDVRFEDFTLQDLVLLATSLRLIQQQVNRAYREELGSLLSRILARQPYAIEQVTTNSATEAKQNEVGQELTEEFSFALVQAAIAHNRKLTIHLISADGQEQSKVQIDEPQLSFEGGWRVTSLGSARSTAAALDKIAKIRIG